jgi:hypothetical protein
MSSAQRPACVIVRCGNLACYRITGVTITDRALDILACQTHANPFIVQRECSHWIVEVARLHYKGFAAPITRSRR